MEATRWIFENVPAPVNLEMEAGGAARRQMLPLPERPVLPRPALPDWPLTPSRAGRWQRCNAYPRLQIAGHGAAASGCCSRRKSLTCKTPHPAGLRRDPLPSGGSLRDGGYPPPAAGTRNFRCWSRESATSCAAAGPAGKRCWMTVMPACTGGIERPLTLACTPAPNRLPTPARSGEPRNPCPRAVRLAAWHARFSRESMISVSLFNLTTGVCDGGGDVAVRGSAPANETDWDMGLPFRASAGLRPLRRPLPRAT
jgi:hypothetical protein